MSRYQRKLPTVTVHAVARYRQRIDPTATEPQARRTIRAALAQPIETYQYGTVTIVKGDAGARRFVALVGRAPETRRLMVLTIDRSWRRQTYGRVADRGSYSLASRAVLPEEAEFIANHLTTRPLPWIAARLGRTVGSVERWCWRTRQCATRQDLVTSGVAAELAGCSQQWITHLARTGQIRAHKKPSGRWWLVDPDDLPRCAEWARLRRWGERTYRHTGDAA